MTSVAPITATSVSLDDNENPNENGGSDGINNHHRRHHSKTKKTKEKKADEKKHRHHRKQRDHHHKRIKKHKDDNVVIDDDDDDDVNKLEDSAYDPKALEPVSIKETTHKKNKVQKKPDKAYTDDDRAGNEEEIAITKKKKSKTSKSKKTKKKKHKKQNDVEEEDDVEEATSVTASTDEGDNLVVPHKTYFSSNTSTLAADGTKKHVNEKKEKIKKKKKVKKITTTSKKSKGGIIHPTDDVPIEEHSSATPSKHDSVDLEVGGKSQQAENEEKFPLPTHHGLSQRWSRFILRNIKSPILKLLLAITAHAAKHPKAYVVCCILVSAFLMGSGLARGIKLDVDQDDAWTPEGSKPLLHGQWLDDESNFPPIPRWYLIFVHQDGENALGKDGITRVFEALDIFRNTDGYQELCSKVQDQGMKGVVLESTGQLTCSIYSPTSFWNHNFSVFEDEVYTDQDAIVAMSALHYPDGQLVDPDTIFGFPVRGVGDSNGMLLENAQAYAVNIALPPTNDDEAAEFEKIATDRMLDLQEEWDNDPINSFRLELFGYDSFTEEFTRAIVKDIPLLPLVFMIMSILCCVFYAQRDIVHSRSLLGFGAVVTVLLGIMCGYGLMFLSGVAFSSLTQILPFILFGIGLDNAFIIIGSYRRKDISKSPVQRIHEVIEDVGGSITLTTLTTATAFALGCISTIPAVFNLCYYAIPCILFGYLGQLTFFTALIVIDEKRIQENRRDCLICFKAAARVEERSDRASSTQPRAHISDRIMEKYGDYLMLKPVKVFVLLGFATLFATMAWQTTYLTQFFDFKDLVPSDSYVIRAVDSLDLYYARRGVAPLLVFRFVDQSDESIQNEMEKYVNDLVGLSQINHQPPFFWLRDFEEFINGTSSSSGTEAALQAALQDAPFEDQLDGFLSIPAYSMYAEDIVRDEETRSIVASRTRVYMDNFDWDIIKEQTKALRDQRDVTESQQINKGKSDWPFFTFDETYYIWEFYEVAVREMKITTIIGVISVSFLAMLFVPHWSALFFVGPLVAILYVDLLGVIHLSGLYVNSVTYVGVLMSVGLIVDYTMHILLRFIECDGVTRELKTKETLRTMGASILLGGVSTLLGVLPLSLSSSAIFHTVFVVFIGLVTLGISHGLILLPVILSLIGPMSHVPKKSCRAV